MTLLLIAGAVVIVALATYFAVRASRTPITVATPAELEARQLDEGMIIGDPVPIGSADDVGVVTVVPTDAIDFTEADDFDESTGPVEPAPPRATGTTTREPAIAPSKSAHVAAAAGNTAPAVATSTDGPAPAPASAAKAPRRHDIRWARRFEPADESFDDATRLSLLNDLGIVRAPWGVPLLAQAYEEEPDVEHRRAALRSLAAYRHPDTQGTFDVALHSDDEEERTIAEHALTALQIRAALTS